MEEFVRNIPAGTKVLAAFNGFSGSISAPDADFRKVVRELLKRTDLKVVLRVSGEWVVRYMSRELGARITWETAVHANVANHYSCVLISSGDGLSGFMFRDKISKPLRGSEVRELYNYFEPLGKILLEA